MNDQKDSFVRSRRVKPGVGVAGEPTETRNFRIPGVFRLTREVVLPHWSVKHNRHVKKQVKSVEWEIGTVGIVLIVLVLGLLVTGVPRL